MLQYKSAKLVVLLLACQSRMLDFHFLELAFGEYSLPLCFILKNDYDRSY